jgi:DedD protein
MATEQLSEQEVQLRKRARRRLVGAVALVLLMVTVLPMVLDDRAEQMPQPEIAVSIPSQDNGDFASKIVAVEPVATPQPETPEPAAVQAQSPVAVPDPAPVKPAELAKTVEAKVEAPVVKEVPLAPVAAPEKPASASGSFAVQIGVYSDKANVRKLQEKLSAQGFKSYTANMNTPKGEKVRLRVGPFVTRAEAEKARDALKSSGMAGIVVAK